MTMTYVEPERIVFVRRRQNQSRIELVGWKKK
jgi:hypothetical protein